MACRTMRLIEMLSRYVALKFCPCSMARFRSSRIPARKETNCAPAGVSAAPFPLRSKIGKPTSSSSSLI